MSSGNIQFQIKRSQIQTTRSKIDKMKFFSSAKDKTMKENEKKIVDFIVCAKTKWL